MSVTKRLVWATTALTSSLLLATAAMAQSTASQEIDDANAAADDAAEVEQVVVTGQRVREIEGFRAETAPKARVTIGEELIQTQTAGQTIFQTLNLVPGLNFTNTDPYGSAGGNVRLRGFDGSRISLTFDGIPLNDTGNYAIFTNQQLDPELISSANVNTGTTDVDSPTASATGGTINYITRRPADDPGVLVKGSGGSFNYRRAFGIFDTGELGPFDTSAFAAASFLEYDKFRGPGELQKQQYNARIYQPLRDRDFLSVAFHYNRNRNNFYRNISLANFLQSGGNLENDQECRRLAAVNGTAQNEATGNTIVNNFGETLTGSCTNYHNLRINPSDTGNIRAQSRFDLGRGLQLTVDPYFQYVIANGGGFQTIAETDGRLRGPNSPTRPAGVSLNGDADFLDTVTLYTPNTTNTRRYGGTASLLFSLNDQHRFRLGYTLDYGKHRQTGDFGFVDQAGNPENVYAGKDGYGRKVLTADGSNLRGRDRFSLATLTQISAQYRGEFFEDRLLLDIGVRAPLFKRELNQFCFTQNGTTNQLCTTDTPILQPNGNVRFGTSTLEYVQPYERNVEYEDVLPNIGVSYELFDNQRVFFSFAQTLSAPRTDDLYSAFRPASTTPVPVRFPDVQPESATNYDLGYRYATRDMIVYGTVFTNDFQNRIVSSFDPDLGFNVSRNVGAVKIKGAEFQVTRRIQDMLTLNAFASYTDAELQEDQPATTATGAPLATRGKQLVETPQIQFGGRAQLELFDGFSTGVQFKYVDSRFSNDINTESAPDYTLWDMDARYRLTRFGFDDTFVQLNLQNLFDEEYLGNINSSTNGTGTFSVGAPFTAQLSLQHRF
jgi:iron complex outermembrane receptor protein